MSVVRRGALVACALLCATAAASGDDAASTCAPEVTPSGVFAANSTRAGLIDLYYFLAQGATVTFYECVGNRAVELGQRSEMRGDITPMYAATTWSCTRRTRRFAATVTLPDGTAQRGVTDIRTQSCRQRFRLNAPRRAARGRRVALRFTDRWAIGGIKTRWCVTPPRAGAACRALRFGTAERVARRSFVPRRRGRWRVSLHVGRDAVGTTVAVGVRSVPPRHLPRVLATGDSTMQGVDVSLADELAGTADVISDVHPGAALSFERGWQPIAEHQAERHAAVVVLSIGAAEGFPMTSPDGMALGCCDSGWVSEYARRMGNVLAAYRRHSRVIVLTVVAPRDPKRAPIVAAVTTATLRAATGMRGVRVLRMDQFFTPNGYQETIRYRGRDISVREPDGVHLNVVGTTIEARETAPTVRAMLSR